MVVARNEGQIDASFFAGGEGFTNSVAFGVLQTDKGQKGMVLF